MRGRRDAGPIKGGRRGSWGCAPWRARRDLRRENRVSLAQWRGEGDEAARWGRWVSGALRLCGVERGSLAGLGRLVSHGEGNAAESWPGSVGAGRAGRGGSGALDWARRELLWAAGERTGPRWAEEKGERLGRIGLSARLGCGEKE